MSNTPSRNMKIWMVVASAFFWAWFDNATFRPSLFLLSSTDPLFFNLCFIVTMLSGSLILLLASLKSSLVKNFIANRAAGACVISSAVAGNGLVLLGASFNNTALIVLGSLLAGIACQLLVLQWATLYSKQGAKSASLLVASAIALGVVLDVIIIGLDPTFSTVFTMLLPLPSLAAFYFGKKGEGQTVKEIEAPPNSTHPISLDTIFPSSRYRVLGLSLSLVFAFFFFGFAFGFMQYETAFITAEISPFASAILLVARGASAAIIFLATYFAGRRIYAVYRVAIFVGIAGFIVIPSIGTVVSGQLFAGFIIAIGYTTFDIISFTLLAEIVYVTRSSSYRVFGSGRLIVHTAVAFGWLFAFVGFSQFDFSAVQNILSSTIGYFVVIAAMLLLSDSSALWMLVRYGKIYPRDPILEQSVLQGTQKGSGIEGHKTPSDMLEEAGLTEREHEILNLLLIGRSAPRIAKQLTISESTVNSHIRHIYGKLGIHNRQELLDVYSANL